jgi:hypothetical protein
MRKVEVVNSSFIIHFICLQNLFKGGGCEPEQHYALWKRLHRHLEKHSILQESYMKLMEGINRDNQNRFHQF